MCLSILPACTYMHNVCVLYPPRLDKDIRPLKTVVK